MVFRLSAGPTRSGTLGVIDWDRLAELEQRQVLLAARAKQLILSRIRAAEVGGPIGSFDSEIDELAREAERIEREIQLLWDARFDEGA